MNAKLFKLWYNSGYLDHDLVCLLHQTERFNINWVLWRKCRGTNELPLDLIKPGGKAEMVWAITSDIFYTFIADNLKFANYGQLIETNGSWAFSVRENETRETINVGKKL